MSNTELYTFAGLLRDTSAANGDTGSQFSQIMVVRARDPIQAIWKLTAVAEQMGKELERLHEGPGVYEVFNATFPQEYEQAAD